MRRRVVRLTPIQLDHEQGSALLLIPAIVLIVIGAAALIVDSAQGFAAKRALVEAASAAANDASNGIDRNSLYSEGNVRLEPARASRFADQAIRERVDQNGIDVENVAVNIKSVDGEQRVTIGVTATKDRVFGGFFGHEKWNLSAEVTSIVHESEGP